MTATDAEMRDALTRITTVATRQNQQRADLETLAIQHTNEQATDAWVARELHDLRRDLSPWKRWELWEDYQAALDFRQKVHLGDIGPAEVEAELADWGILADRAQQRVDEALDELIHGGRLRAALREAVDAVQPDHAAGLRLIKNATAAAAEAPAATAGETPHHSEGTES